MARLSGCNRFIEAIDKYGLTDEITDLVNKNKTITLFCPVDDALEHFALYPRSRFEKSKVRELLRHHVAVKHDSYGTMYRTLSNHGHVVLHPKHASKTKVIDLYFHSF